jgi:hypothetical protein
LSAEEPAGRQRRGERRAAQPDGRADGRRAVGLYQLLLGEGAATDDELVEDSEAQAQLLALLRAEAYRRIPANDAVPELLCAIGSGDFDRVAELVAAVGISPWDLLRGPGGVALLG